MSLRASFFLLLAIFGTVSALREQAVGCEGILLCGDKPATNVRVALWDEDDGPDPDDKLQETRTDSKGHFKLAGSTKELTNIDPVCKVYHDCDDALKPGQRKVRFRIPSQYITTGTTPKKYFNLGTINLEIKFAKEDRELL
ncbi:unnamed protein product [Bursaphelenchus xylophilus]|uniref:(pine wood nematode) hypothetical protein n=1 Tax=Bursaphelenchus xylophilus TaxID=6326 RepID=A0A1I7RNH3_BURXY|nr:unnamed protein product [Bursaphelenchus xylophilus]CAG9124015.1 unnamed protein product [Bursaphelenchus xylophilus]